jgi:hypothetical protein
MLRLRIVFGDLAMSQDGCGCKDCKRVREHAASFLPFKVLEAMSDKPLRIRGVAMCTRMSGGGGFGLLGGLVFLLFIGGWG